MSAKTIKANRVAFWPNRGGVELFVIRRESQKKDFCVVVNHVSQFGSQFVCTNLKGKEFVLVCRHGGKK